MKTIVYIDGQNFLYKVAERLKNANIISDKQDIVSFDIDGLLRPFFKNEDIEIRYYGVRRIVHSKNADEDLTRKTQRFADSLRRLKNYLVKNGIVFIGKGSLKVRFSEPCKNCGFIEQHFQEKGVDVGIAIDIVRDAMSKSCQNIALVSSDTDLLPALQLAKQEGVKISYVSFAGQSTVSIAKLADENITLSGRAVIDAYLGSLN